MDILEVMKRRHSVRQYTDRAIEGEVLDALVCEIDACNSEAGLHFQLVTNEPRAFSGKMAEYGRFCGVKNYIALVGKKGRELSEQCGYYGERIVMRAHELGLHTCWVALTYDKIPEAFSVLDGEKLTVVISVGYGKNRGLSRKSKKREEVSNACEESPEWFLRGVDAALLAPTAMNQQKFRFTQNGRRVKARAGVGFYTKMDLGIAKYHFELGAGKENFEWE